jgi:two-component system cell cycle response regulator
MPSPEPPQPAEQSSEPSVARPIRALLIESRPDDAERLLEMLTLARPGAVEVMVVEHLSEALLELTRSPHDVVLLDRDLPELDGIDALEQIGDLAPDMPVVVLSGAVDQVATWQITDHGAQEFVVRGDAGSQLLSAIRQAMARKHAEVRLTRMALRDPLTGLANRLLLQERLERASLRANREERSFGVMFLDLDGFKHVNDSLGHEFGDHLLRAVARRLETVIRRVDTVARLGGDEFVMVIEGLRHPGDAVLVAEKTLETLLQPFGIRGHELHIGTSIGISLYPDDSNDLEELIRLADAAMYRAKHAGRNRYESHSQPSGAAAEAQTPAARSPTSPSPPKPD